MAKNPSSSNSDLKRRYNAILKQKEDTLSEIADIKYKIGRAKAEKEREQREREQQEREQYRRAQEQRIGSRDTGSFATMNPGLYSPDFKQERLAALKREQDAEFDRNSGGKKRKKMSNKVSNKRKKHSRRRRTHRRSKY